MRTVPSRSPWGRGSRGLVAVAAGVALCAFAPMAQMASAQDAESAAAPPMVQLVETARESGQAFPVIDVLRGSRSSRQAGIAESSLRRGAVLRPDRKLVRTLLKGDVDAFTLPLRQDDGRTVELELVKVDILTSDFQVITASSNGRPVPYERSVHYRGVVKGDPGSTAAVSVFRDEVMAIYRTAADGPVVLGRLQGRVDEHVLYAEKDLGATSPFQCGMAPEVGPDGSLPVTDDFNSFQVEQHEDMGVADFNILARCARIYVEADYDIYRNKGSVSAATNYIKGVFNQSATLYANESISIRLSSLFVWDRTSPYTATSSSSLLRQFQSYRNSFNGDLGHLVAFRGGGGIAAGFSGFCNSNIDNRQCFSGLQTTYNNVPTYSWTVMVFTHEMGHLMGSRHTHACVWNGNGTAIDGCSRPEGSCSRPGIPSGGGTIMSYCHQQSVGINFNKGFGPQPGNVIRSRFNNASCLQNCP